MALGDVATQVTMIPLKRGAFGYDLPFLITDAAGTAFNLTGYTIKLYTWDPEVGSGTKIIDGGAMSITDAASGTCKYTVADGNFDVAMAYHAEIKLTKSGAEEPSVTFVIPVEESPDS